MYNNIILAGGNTLFPNLSSRLMTTVAELVAPTTKVQITADPGRKYSTWLGGALLASIPSYQQMWVSKEMYDEQGAIAVHDKSLI